jgi:Flp pilus assembly protein TadB
MPWALLIRLATRVLAGMFIWRTATARRNAGAMPVAGRRQRTRLDAAASVRAIREGATLGWRTAATAVLCVAAAVLITGGVTLTVLSPRWLGITMLVLAAFAVMLATLEARLVWRQVAERRRRRRQQALRSQVS